MNKDYTNLKEFWNNAYSLDDKEKEEFLKELTDDSWHDLVPSEKQIDALKTITCCEKILDYGCGNGWASIALAKLGAKNILAVDVSENPVIQTKVLSNAFKLDGAITPKCVSDTWLDDVADSSFDAVFTSNVLDVIPFDISDNIIKELSRILKKEGKLIVSLNYYIKPVENKERMMTVKDDKYLYINGILRLASRTDDEWIEVFKKYFNLEKLEYFAWPGENNETRRLFFLSKKNE